MLWNNIRFDFSGASVLVTGGTGGLGNGIAEAFRDAGADVTITGTRGSASEYDDDLSGYRYIQLDVEDRAQIDAVVAALPKLDILVNSAGLALMMLGLDEFDPDNFERAVTMHLTGIYWQCRAVPGQPRFQPYDGCVDCRRWRHVAHLRGHSR